MGTLALSVVGGVDEVALLCRGRCQHATDASHSFWWPGTGHLCMRNVASVPLLLQTVTCAVLCAVLSGAL